VKTGTIQLDGMNITKDTPYERVRKGVGYVPQGVRSSSPDGARELLMGLATRAAAPRSRRVVRVVPGAQADDQPPRRRPVGGQQQQLAIARALAPAEIADPRRADRSIQPAYHGHSRHPHLATRTMAIVLVEQFYDFAPSSPTVLVMERGEIIQRGRGADMEKDGVRRLMWI